MSGAELDEDHELRRLFGLSPRRLLETLGQQDLVGLRDWVAPRLGRVTDQDTARTLRLVSGQDQDELLREIWALSRRDEDARLRPWRLWVDWMLLLGDSALLAMVETWGCVASPGLRWLVRGAVMAHDRESALALTERVELAPPDFGFDSSGRQEVDFVGRRLRLLLDRDGVRLLDHGGREHLNLPEPRDESERVEVERAGARFFEWRERVSTAFPVAIARMEDAMLRRRWWGPAPFQRLFLDNAVLRLLAPGVVFETRSGRLTVLTLDGALLGIDGEVLALERVEALHIPHPRQLTGEQHREARAFLWRLGLEQPFDQLLV